MIDFFAEKGYDTVIRSSPGLRITFYPGGFPMKKFSIRNLTAVFLGAAVFFVLGRYASISTPVPTISVTFQYGVLAYLAVVFGPAVGALAGFLGHLSIDLCDGVLWWGWIFGSAAFGALVGVLSNVTRISADQLDRRMLLHFNVIQVAVHVVCWAGIAPVLDIWWYGESIDKLFDQGLTAALVNASTTAIVGSALLVAHAARKRKTDPAAHK